MNDPVSYQYVIAVDPTTGALSGWRPVVGIPVDADAIVIPSGVVVTAVGALNYAFDGTDWNRVRGARVFKTISATASGNTAVWTPTTGTRFHLLGFTISVAGTLATTGVQVIQLRDGASSVLWRGLATVSDTPIGDTQMAADYGVFGITSAALEQVLNVNLGTAMATGAVVVNAWGTEEAT